MTAWAMAKRSCAAPGEKLGPIAESKASLAADGTADGDDMSHRHTPRYPLRARCPVCTLAEPVY